MSSTEFHYHAFLTHDWNSDQHGRDNHKRVAEVNRYLQSRGLATWFDEDRMEGNIVDQICSGIEKSVLVIVFITQTYVQKVAQTEKTSDYCKLEFQHSCRKRTTTNMIPVVMEQRMLNTASWDGAVGMMLGGNLYVDMHDGNPPSQLCLDDLYNSIINKTSIYNINPKAVVKPALLTPVVNPIISNPVQSPPTPVGAVTTPTSPAAVAAAAAVIPVVTGGAWHRVEGDGNTTQRVGYGTYTWTKGDKYEGEWKNDLREGQGTYWWASGGRYEGEWKNDVKTGRGTMYWQSGNRYVGEWKNGRLCGKGTKYWTNGDRYEGDWSNDDRDGQGTYWWATGSRYEGEWVKDKKEGKGTMFWNSGNKYVGDWKDGKMCGKGTKYWTNGDRYEGDWANDCRHGQGKMYWANGKVETGTWKDDQKV